MVLWTKIIPFVMEWCQVLTKGSHTKHKLLLSIVSCKVNGPLNVNKKKDRLILNVVWSIERFVWIFLSGSEHFFKCRPFHLAIYSSKTRKLFFKYKLSCYELVLCPYQNEYIHTLLYASRIEIKRNFQSINGKSLSS